MEGAKGDIDLSSYLVEAKSTTGHSIGLKHEWLSKIAHEARNVGKNPAVTLSFTHGNGRPVPEGEWVAIPMWLFKEKCL
jgi:Holliday junction resolvase